MPEQPQQPSKSSSSSTGVIRQHYDNNKNNSSDRTDLDRRWNKQEQQLTEATVNHYVSSGSVGGGIVKVVGKATPTTSDPTSSSPTSSSTI